MYYLLALLCAATISGMSAINGQLSLSCDAFASTVLIHASGLIGITLIVLFRKEKLFLRGLVRPALYAGGAIGVGTTIFNNAAYGHISLSAILALSLLSQAVTSLIIDHFGFFHMPVRKFNPGKLAGFLFTLFGILCLFHGSKFVLLPVLFSLFMGITIVCSRSVNAELAEKSSVWVSTWYNYVVGLIVCTIVWVFAVCSGTSTFTVTFDAPWWVYTGGLIGIVSVTLQNIVTKKMPAFILTLFMFVGQLFTGIVIDFFTGDTFSISYILGGFLTALGLCFNLWLDQKAANECPASTVL